MNALPRTTNLERLRRAAGAAWLALALVWSGAAGLRAARATQEVQFRTR